MSAEEKSILENAQVNMTEVWAANYYYNNALVDKFFKTRTLADPTNNNNGKKELSVKLTASQTIVTTFLLNGADILTISQRLGRAHIWVGDDNTFLSTANTKCTADIFDTGFYESIVACRGSTVAIRRDG